MQSTLEVKILLVRSDFILTLGREGQLVFLPTCLHENDFVPDLDYYKKLNKTKVVVYK